MKLAYCDYIADRIQKLLDREIGDNETLISNVGNVQMDLHPTEGWFQSTKKVIQVTDTNGKSYVVTVEEAPELWFEDVDQATLDAEE
jgi:hypothetical protein